MFKLYGSDEEHIAALKQWWKDHGWTTVISVTLGLSLSFAYMRYQQWSHHQMHLSSIAYQHYIEGDLSKKPDVKGSFQSPALLVHAKYLIKMHQNDQALAILTHLSQDKTPAIHHIANYLSALIYMEQKQYDHAENLLKPLAQTPFASFSEEALGDIAHLKKDASRAHQYYQQALNHFPNTSQFPILRQTLIFKQQHTTPHEK